MAKDMNSFLVNQSIFGRTKKANKRKSASASQKKLILAKQKQRCAGCRKLLGASVHFHHKKFVSQGGKTTTKNMIAVCGSCHDAIHIQERAKKSDRKKKKSTTKPIWEQFP